MQQSCTMEFDGASKGNPGRAGAGAVLRAEDGTLVYLKHKLFTFYIKLYLTIQLLAGL